MKREEYDFLVEKSAKQSAAFQDNNLEIKMITQQNYIQLFLLSLKTGSVIKKTYFTPAMDYEYSEFEVRWFFGYAKTHPDQPNIEEQC